MKTPEYSELHTCSNFSFLRGASHPEDFVSRSADLSYRSIALTDRDGLYGAVRFQKKARELREAGEVSVKTILGSEVTLTGGSRVVLLVRNREGYANLSRLISRGRLARPKGESEVSFSDLAEHSCGLIALSGSEESEIGKALLRGKRKRAEEEMDRYLSVFGREGFYLEIHNHHLSQESYLAASLSGLGEKLSIDVVATSLAHYALPRGRPLQDVLTCIREKTTLDAAKTRLLPNGEFYLKDRNELGRNFRHNPQALRNTLSASEKCEFKFDRVDYRLPSFDSPPGETPFSYLHRLTYEGARYRYRPLTPRAARQIAHELDIIHRLDLAGYFLIVWDIVRFCREENILCQGRGSAANSAVCYCLRITSVDPVGLDLLFERFLSEDRKEPPDIDLDISHQLREKVIQYVYDKYGRNHASMVCEIISYHARSAVRDVGKALGFSLAQVDRAAKALHWGKGGSAMFSEAALGGELGLHPDSPRMRYLLSLVQQIEGFPRHLGIHVGGMVITQNPLSSVVPIENATMQDRTVIQWDKDDVSEVGLVKIDLLGLGMLTLIQMAIELVKKHEDVEIDLAHLPMDDTEVYDMLCRADTVGVFQVESRAQMNTLPRMKPRCFYDIVIEIALIRPGPIQGDMVHPYLRRRSGKEPVTYLHPSLKPVLSRTLGVPLFQEQGMKVAVAAAGFSPAEADELRRAMGFKRATAAMNAISEKLRDGMRKNGISPDIAERIHRQLTAFASYGFPESHSASFALLVYASAYLKHHHPAAFTCALLNAQPMGFYSPATIVMDAKRHGVRFHAINVMQSEWDCTLEDSGENSGENSAVRIGMRYVRGMGAEAGERVKQALHRRPFTSMEDFVQKTGLPRPSLKNLAGLGAFDDFCLNRREALWRVLAVAAPSPGPLVESTKLVTEVLDEGVTFPPMKRVEKTEADYSLTGISTRHHPLEFFRASLDEKGILTAVDLEQHADRKRVLVAGLVICRQHPGTAKGFTFLTLEDETGLVNVVIRPRYFEKNRVLLSLNPLLIISGMLEKKEGVTNVLGDRFFSLGELPMVQGLRSRDFH